MNVSTGLQFLRPFIFMRPPIHVKSAYIRFFNTSKCLGRPTSPEKRNINTSINTPDRRTREPRSPLVPATQFAPRHEVEERIKELEDAKALVYPRVEKHGRTLSVLEYREVYGYLGNGEECSKDTVTVHGRVNSVRIAGKALVFLDIVQDGRKVQGICNANKLVAFNTISSSNFRQFYHLVRRGDIISITGFPTRTNAGELSIFALDLPKILSPSLASLPKLLEDRQTRIRNRHVDLLVNKKTADTIRVRSHIIQYIRNFFLKDKFLEVQTPIISDAAGGAIARPFATVATEFSNKELSLRIAPEIWLKRMILGGMDRVFEIGPAFRNEGLDATHNPEFTTCEFYKSFADLEELISMTERMISGLAEYVTSLRASSLTELPQLDASLFSTPFKRLEFIPTIETGLNQSLPDLTADDATERLLAIFDAHKIPTPLSPTLPRLLDKLSSIYIEPQCDEPTFIMHHPACMAPLAKSFIDTATKQDVSARVELFIQQKEIANMYEEENSPFEQRKKFVQQVQYKDDENTALLDESYLEALEWGLPPTGGWGCGIDRLCMFLSGSSRISDVLSFGSLKNVVSLGKDVPPGKDKGLLKDRNTQDVQDDV